MRNLTSNTPNTPNTPNTSKTSKTSEDMINNYLVNGGSVTQCKTHNPGGRSSAIRTKGARKRDINSSYARIISGIRFDAEHE